LAGSTGRRTPWIVLAAVVLVLTGVGAIVYGPFLPVPGWMSIRLLLPVLGAPPVALVALGLLSIAAGGGVFGVRTWGRVLGVVSTIVSLGYAAWRSLQGAPPEASLQDLLAALLAGAWLGTALSLVVLFVLLRRWPRSERARADSYQRG
jgi:hypothetical protein